MPVNWPSSIKPTPSPLSPDDIINAIGGFFQKYLRLLSLSPAQQADGRREGAALAKHPEQEVGEASKVCVGGKVGERPLDVRIHVSINISFIVSINVSRRLILKPGTGNKLILNLRRCEKKHFDCG